MSFEPINVRQVMPSEPVKRVNEADQKNPNKQNKKFLFELKKEEEKKKEEEASDKPFEEKKSREASTRSEGEKQNERTDETEEEPEENHSAPGKGKLIDVII